MLKAILISSLIGSIFLILAPHILAQIKEGYEKKSAVVYTTVGDYAELLPGEVSCSGIPISLGIEKKLLPLPSENILGENIKCSTTQFECCGRPGVCMTPKRIVLHTTEGPISANDIYQYFAKGAPGGGGRRGVASHFGVGRDGATLQMVESYDTLMEKAYAVANYGDHISIEMGSASVFKNKAAVPAAQYQATLNLVKKLMKQYNIPLGDLEYDWKASSDFPTADITAGVFGHYQLNPSDRTDPGIGFMQEFREDLK